MSREIVRGASHVIRGGPFLLWYMDTPSIGFPDNFHRTVLARTISPDNPETIITWTILKVISTRKIPRTIPSLWGEGEVWGVGKIIWGNYRGWELSKGCAITFYLDIPYQGPLRRTISLNSGPSVSNPLCAYVTLTGRKVIQKHRLSNSLQHVLFYYMLIKHGITLKHHCYRYEGTEARCAEYTSVVLR